MLDKMTNVINTALSNKHTYAFFTLFSGIFLGYTLQPVPNWLNDIFNTNQLFKYFVIVIVGLTVTYPVDKTEFIAIIIIAAVILVLLELMREKIEKYVDQTIDEKLNQKIEKLRV